MFVLVLHHFFCSGELQQYIVTIGLLIGGLMVTQQIGGIAASIAGKGMGAINKGRGMVVGAGVGAGMWGGRKIWSGTKTAGRGALTVASYADKQLGKSISSDKYGDGMFKKSYQTVRNVPEKLKTKFNDIFVGDSKVNSFLRDVHGEEVGHEAEFNGRKYKKHANGSFFEVDENGKTVKTKDSKGREMMTWLKDNKNKRVKDMSSNQVSWHDAKKDAFSGAQAVKNKAQAEAIDVHQKNIADSNMTTGEMTRELNNTATSNNRKMALAMTLAIKEGFRNNKDVEKARGSFGSNHLLLDKFNDEVDKNQAHLSYNIQDPAGQAAFKSRVDSGKIDTTKLNAEAYEDENMIQTLKEYHGRDFKRVVETSFKRGKKYEKSVDKGLLKLRDSQAGDDRDKTAVLHARLTGDFENSFVKSGGGFDYDVFGSYLQNTKAADLNKMDSKKLEVFMKDASAADAVRAKMTYAKLKSMHKQGDNSDLVRKLREEMIKDSKHKALIDKDDELRTV